MNKINILILKSASERETVTERARERPRERKRNEKQKSISKSMEPVSQKGLKKAKLRNSN